MERQSELLMWACVAAILFASVLAGVALRSPELDTATPDTTNNPLPGIRQSGLSNPVQAATPTATATPEPIDDTTNTRTHHTVEVTKDEWSPCDQRHNASHRYAMGCYDGGSSGRPQAPVQPIPELPTGLLMAFGLLFVAQRRGR